MQNLRSTIFLIAVCTVTALTSNSAVASGPRQYYGAWQKHPERSYYYRPLYYKPNVDYSGYKHHYVICYPSRPKYVYFYNPYKKTYWGRCELNRNGKNLYSMLPENYRKSNLSDIPESAFPSPTLAPALPDTTDGILLDLPPDDLPPGLDQTNALPEAA